MPLTPVPLPPEAEAEAAALPSGRPLCGLNWPFIVDEIRLSGLSFLDGSVVLTVSGRGCATTFSAEGLGVSLLPLTTSLSFGTCAWSGSPTGTGSLETSDFWSGSPASCKTGSINNSSTTSESSGIIVIYSDSLSDCLTGRSRCVPISSISSRSATTMVTLNAIFWPVSGRFIIYQFLHLASAQPPMPDGWRAPS